MTSPGVAADHMEVAFRRIYAENRCPHITRLPSGGLVVQTGEFDPFGNFAIGLSPAEWVGAAEQLASHAVPSIIMRPGERHAAMESAIEPFGFVHAEAIPGMTADLSQTPAVELPDGYSIERFNSSGDGEAWANTFCTAYPVSPIAGRSFSPVDVPIDDAPDADLQYFQAVHDGQPVAVSALLLAGEAGIYCVATHPDHRRRGLGAAMTAHPMQIARDLGYRTAVLQASEAGYQTYRRLGFADESEVQLYIRMPEG